MLKIEECLDVRGHFQNGIDIKIKKFPFGCFCDLFFFSKLRKEYLVNGMTKVNEQYKVNKQTLFLNYIHSTQNSEIRREVRRSVASLL